MAQKILGVIMIGVLILLPFNVHSSSITEDKESQEKCEKQCEKFFEKQYGDGTLRYPESTDIYSYKSHYNKNKQCFILLEANIYPKDAKKSMITFKKLVNINENKIQGVYVSNKTATSCNVSGTEYKDCSNQKWDTLLKPFMEE